MYQTTSTCVLRYRDDGNLVTCFQQHCERAGVLVHTCVQPCRMMMQQEVLLHSTNCVWSRQLLHPYNPTDRKPEPTSTALRACKVVAATVMVTVQPQMQAHA